MKRKLLFFLLILFSFGMYAEEYFLYLPFRSFDVFVSSYLTEGDIQYSEENLSPENELPWGPNGDNNGKDAKIVIRNCFSKQLYISSGYFKPGREDLYYKNSRPKIIEVYLKNKRIVKRYKLEDTPVPQELILSDVEEYLGTVEISFLDVYEGTKYKDLCINFIARQRIKNDTDFFKSFEIINEELAKINCYVRILPMFYEKWRPEKTFGGCPIESTALFKHSHCEDFIEYDGDGIFVKKILFEKYIFPEFEKLNYSIENLTYTQEGDTIIKATFEINLTTYCMKAWIYTEDYLLLTFDCI